MDRSNGSGAPREGSPERSGGLPSQRGEPDPEVPARATRRRFSGEYKLRILREAGACKASGEVGALLRREGLYASHLAAWRKELRRHGVEGLKSRRRGPKAKPRPSTRELQLEREKRKLEKRLAKAEAIIEFQKKVHALLGIPLSSPESGDDD